MRRPAQPQLTSPGARLAASTRAARRLNNVATNPLPYAAWAVLVILALLLAYLADPYVFALATLVLAGISAAISLVGLAVALLSKGLRRSRRAWIMVSLAATGAAVVAALWLVRGFQWA